MTSLIQKSINNSLTHANSAEIAGFAMPSDNFIDLTLGSSGSTYTAPANGWFAISKISGSSDRYVQLYNSTNHIGINAYVPYTGGVGLCFIPVKKGDTVTVSYDLIGSTIYFRFYYAKGEI